MPKTRRTKLNKSPLRPYRNSRAYVAEKGDMITTTGLRGRTQVKRVADAKGKRLTTIRAVEAVKQPKQPLKAIPIFAGRVYTGVARSRAYAKGLKQGGPGTYRGDLPKAKRHPGIVNPEVAKGLMGGLAKAARAVKKVLVTDHP